jgi:cell division protein FtsQ
MIFVFSFSAKKNSERKLLKTKVSFTNGDNLFINETMVNKLLIEKNNEVKTIGKVALNLDNIEKEVNKNPIIEKAEIFVSVDGVLNARVKQKTPIARVFNGVTSYYIDYEGTKMPLSDLNTARVLLISGNVDAKNIKNITAVSKMIYEDEFLKKNIIGIKILEDQSLVMMNRNYNYEIDFGKMINCERKFMDYKAFFQKAVQDSTLYKYKKINLKFTQQVVCIK